MVIRWLNPYGTDWQYAVTLPNGSLWITEDVQNAIDVAAMHNLTSSAIAFCRKQLVGFGVQRGSNPLPDLVESDKLRDNPRIGELRDVSLPSNATKLCNVV